MPSSATETTIAELNVLVEHFERYRERVAALAVPHLGTDRDDLVAVIYEAERSILTASRTLRRAAKVAAAS
jgi:hypothetical protein